MHYRFTGLLTGLANQAGRHLHIHGYYVCMSLTHRLQVLLDEDQYQRLAKRAHAEQRSVGSMIREAVDLVWTGPNAQKVSLLEALLAEEPMSVPDPEELSRQLQDYRSERFSGV